MLAESCIRSELLPGKAESQRDTDPPKGAGQLAARGWKAGRGQTDGIGNGFVGKDTPEPGLQTTTRTGGYGALQGKLPCGAMAGRGHIARVLKKNPETQESAGYSESLKEEKERDIGSTCWKDET